MDMNNDVEVSVEYKSLKERQRQKLLEIAKTLKRSSRALGTASDDESSCNETADANDSIEASSILVKDSSRVFHAAGPKASISLLDQSMDKKKKESLKSERERLMEEEKLLLESLVVNKKLQSDYELAKGIRYTESLTSTWTPPNHLISLSEAENHALRKQYLILVEGESVPPPCPSFREMRLPEAILAHFTAQGIDKPTPIQMQGLPVALSGRDMIGIAFTGSGKTICFTLPVILKALEEELKMPFIAGEGPVGLIICPSRELALQIFEVAQGLVEGLVAGGLPRLRGALCIGGTGMMEQMKSFSNGVHFIVATPGRLLHMLNQNHITLAQCRYFCMDEADRMVDLGFEEEVRNIMSHFQHQRQTLLFSATMPEKIRTFASASLVRPVTVNVGRAGAANLDVVQEVEFVEKDVKIMYLLRCLQRTPPPVLLFAENRNDVDDIYEYLLLKGVEAVAIHGSKDQSEREYAIQSFRNGKKDVLVATDVASKGLDFPDIKHVINFDMPKEIEDYVHRIGRTGRRGHRGLATTFVNHKCSDQILSDLKHLLIEAKQNVPSFLDSVAGPGEATLSYGVSESAGVKGESGCAFCGGLGHRIAECPKIEAQKVKLLHQNRTMDFSADGGSY